MTNMTNRTNTAVSVVFISSFLFLLSANLVFADEPQKISFVYPWTGATTPAGFVSKLYQVSLGLAAASALGVIIFGGIMWSLSEAVTKKEEAKSWIAGGIWGLVLLLSAYLILNTINPDLVNLKNPALEPINIAPPPPLGLPAVDYSKIPILGADQKKAYSNDESVSILKQNGIQVDSTQKDSSGKPCLGVNKEGCTDLNGTLGIGIRKLIILNKEAGFTSNQMVVTGANETAGHGIAVNKTTHGDGLTFDISARNRADDNIMRFIQQDSLNPKGTKVYDKNGNDLGTKYIFSDGSTILREAESWHVHFTNRF